MHPWSEHSGFPATLYLVGHVYLMLANVYCCCIKDMTESVWLSLWLFSTCVTLCFIVYPHPVSVTWDYTVFFVQEKLHTATLALNWFISLNVWTDLPWMWDKANLLLSTHRAPCLFPLWSSHLQLNHLKALVRTRLFPPLPKADQGALV